MLLFSNHVTTHARSLNAKNTLSECGVLTQHTRRERTTAVEGRPLSHLLSSLHDNPLLLPSTTSLLERLA